MADDLLAHERIMGAEQRLQQLGPAWVATYVQPFYLSWMSSNVLRSDLSDDPLDLIPELRTRAGELDRDTIRLMLGAGWRNQVMGCWYAVARDDHSLADAVNDSLDLCFGHLTAAPFAVAAVRLANHDTVTALRSFRDRHPTKERSSVAIMVAALARLDALEPGDELDPARGEPARRPAGDRRAARPLTASAHPGRMTPMTDHFLEHGTSAEILDVIAQLPALPYAARGDQQDWIVDGHEGESFDRLHMFGLASHPDKGKVRELATRLAVAADQRWGKRTRFACAAVTPKSDPAHILDPRAVPAATLQAMGSSEAEVWRFGENALLLAVNPSHNSGVAICVALVMEASYLEKPLDRFAEADAEMASRLRKAGKSSKKQKSGVTRDSELLSEFLSRDQARISAAIDVVNRSGDTALLAPVAAELRAVLAGLDAADFVIVDGNPVELAVDRLEIVRDGGCLCATYPRRSVDPEREEQQGWVRIESETCELGGRPKRVVACTSCGTVFDVEEGEYHYTWWKWVSRG